MQDEKEREPVFLDEVLRLRRQIKELEIEKNDLSPAKLALLKAHAELAQQVDERTAELAPANYRLECRLEEFKRIEEAIRESEEKYRNLFYNSPIGLGIVDENGHLAVFNNSMLRPGGYSTEDMAGLNIIEFYYNPKARNRLLAIARKQGFVDEAEVQFKRKDGTPYDALLSLRPVRIKGRLCWHVMVQDVTKRKRTERALRESSAQIRNLNQQLLKAQETERQNISRCLHDSLANDLSAVKLGCENLFNNHPEVPVEIRQNVSEFCTILQEAIRIVRDISHDLSPACLDKLGLERAVFQYGKDFSEKTGLIIDFASVGLDGLSLEFDTKINLYRVIQEGLNNINKHAEAENATVRLIASFPKIILRIEDDGKGFDPEKRIPDAIEEKRMGLQSMRERIKLLGGIFNIYSQSGAGTRIFIEIPYDKAVG